MFKRYIYVYRVNEKLEAAPRVTFHKLYWRLVR